MIKMEDLAHAIAAFQDGAGSSLHTVGNFLEKAFPRTLELFHDDTGL